MDKVKLFLLLLIRTLLATFVCIFLWIFSGKIFNFLPAILFMPTVVLYYPVALLFYFVIASDDRVSTMIGILISISFAILYIINIIGDLNLFTRILFILGIILGLAQTINSVGIRFTKQDYSRNLF